MVLSDPKEVNGHAHAPADFHVLVVGAGITGLLVTHGLKKAGIKYSIFEAEPSFTHYRPREWSMGVHWSLPQLQSLLPEDLAARLKEAQNDPYLEYPPQDILPIFNGLTGEIMKAVPIPKTVRFSRRKLRAFCTEGLDIQYGKELADIEYGPDGNGVTAIFKDGTKATGTMIIGADGPRSSVRNILLGEDKASITPLGVVHANIAVKFHDAEKSKFVRSAHQSFSMVTHPDCLNFISIQDVPDPEKPEDWRFQVVTSWLGERDPLMSDAERLAQVKEKAKVLPEPFRSANLWMPDDTRVTYDRIGYWIPIPWDNHGGRATLCGDAAHPMTPHRGQGLNHAICDASNLIKIIQNVRDGETNLSEAISAYDAEVRRRGQDEVIASRASCYQMLDWNQVMDSPIMKRGLEKGKLDEPVESEQDGANHVQAEPKLEVPKQLQKGSIEADSDTHETADPGPATTEELEAKPVDVLPVEADSDKPEPVEPEPEPVKSEHLEAKEADKLPSKADTNQNEFAEPEAVKSEQSEAKQTDKLPSNAETNQTEVAEPESVNQENLVAKPADALPIESKALEVI